MFGGVFLFVVLATVLESDESKAQRLAEKAARVAAQEAAAAEAAKPLPPDQLAKTACKEFVKKSLNDPGSAEFGDNDTWSSVDRGEGVYRVVLSLRAKNAFNALMYAEFRCDVSLKDDGWRLIALDQTTP